ncbi:MAG: flagellar biosynthetic protein FliR [Phycisphaerales bacterium JB039]
MTELLEHIPPFMLVLARLLGLFLFAPILGSRVLPRQARVALALSMAAAVYPFARAAPPDADIYTLAMMAFGEALIGVGIGLLASIPLVAFELGGMLMGYQMGLSVARAFNPEQDTQTDVVGQLMFYLALGAFVTLGGMEAMFAALVLTFQSAPVGTFWATGLPAEAILGLFGASFEIGLRVAAPGLAVSTLALVGMALVMKTMPQINILSVGFAIKIMIGLGVIALALKAVDSVAGVEIEQALGHIEQWVTSPGMARATPGGAPGG